MKKKLIMLLLAAVLAAVLSAVPAMAGEDYADGDTEQIYVWVQEGDARFCYVNNGGWSEADMLTGWHTIDGETYYFWPQEMEDARYGQMATGEVWIGAWTFYFDSDGRLYDWQEGLD